MLVLPGVAAVSSCTILVGETLVSFDNSRTPPMSPTRDLPGGEHATPAFDRRIESGSRSDRPTS